MRLYRISRIVLLPFKRPLLLLISTIFTAVLYAPNSQAGVVDIHNPKWVMTMATFILLSPFFHGVYILLAREYEMGKTLPMRQALSQTASLYPRLVMGEILVNLGVVAGLFLFVLPGIYVGLRLIFYKQAILIDRASGITGPQTSFRRTAGWRAPLFLILWLAPIYGGVVLIGYAVATYSLGIFGEGLAIIGSILSFAWANALLTSLYLNPALIASFKGS